MMPRYKATNESAIHSHAFVQGAAPSDAHEEHLCAPRLSLHLAVALVSILALMLIGCGSTGLFDGDRAPVLDGPIGDQGGDHASLDAPVNGPDMDSPTRDGNGQPGTPDPTPDVTSDGPGSDDVSDGHFDGADVPDNGVRRGCFESDDPECADRFEEEYSCVDLSGIWEGIWYGSRGSIALEDRAEMQIFVDGCRATGNIVFESLPCFSEGEVLIDQRFGSRATRVSVRTDVIEVEEIEMLGVATFDGIDARVRAPLRGGVCDGAEGGLRFVRLQ